ncbi:putative serine/threonine protein kinase [Trypanosoma theileri]|uniref:Putative serine/threonine protein kinase n=1 Tax=Trypanosoma theileri TaxID=67003 RepID=A0A1X0NJL2_9TRYP|nr:putative serine/threonine protein kinase [Trypanosoma theileri]ORC84827.1 putative serine/threonine protein kinase [Trypanosoma theileri]
MKDEYARVETVTTSPTGRVVIVGDIHGCLAQLQELLRVVGFNKEKDLLISVGDMVNKGPDSIGVLTLLRSLGVRSVLGNHEVKLLKLRKALRKEGEIPKKYRDSTLAPLAKDLPLEMETYLSQLPHILRIPSHNLIIVHAGLHPQLPLERQRVKDITTMRNLISHADGSLEVSEETNAGVPWASLWRGPEVVVFGHDARRNVQQLPFAFGLDSRCVYGGKLTALIYPGGSLVSVPGWTAGSPNM